MENLSTASNALSEISADLKGTLNSGLVELDAKFHQVKSAVTMLHTFVESIDGFASFPFGSEITDGFYVTLSVIGIFESTLDSVGEDLWSISRQLEKEVIS